MRVFLASFLIIVTLWFSASDLFADPVTAGPPGLYSAEATKANDQAKAAYDAGDFKQAVEIWQALAKAGDHRAQFNLGSAYLDGDGVDVNYTESLRWYKKAVTQKRDGRVLRVAAFNIAYMVSNGFGVSKSPALNECFLRAAAENGDSEAQYWIAEVLNNKPDQRDEMISWVRRAANQGDVASQWWMATLGRRYAEIGLVESYKQYFIRAMEGNERIKKEIAEDRERPDKEIQKAIKDGEQLAADWKPVLEPIPNPPVPVPKSCLEQIRGQ